MRQRTKQEVQLAKKYVATKAQNLPFYTCYTNDDWHDSHQLTQVYVSREMPSGKICFCMYLIDKGCLGLKSTSFFINFEKDEYEDFAYSRFSSTGQPFVEITPATAHNIIFGGIDYAEECGFAPQDKDWRITERFLDEELITDEIDNIEFGKDGKPFYMSGPYDNVSKIMGTLRKNFGEDGFIYTTHMGDFPDF